MKWACVLFCLYTWCKGISKPPLMAVGIGLWVINPCHQYLHLQVLGWHRKKPTLANSTGKFCGKQPTWLLRHYPAQLAAETVAVSKQRMLCIYYVKMSALRHFWYRMCYVLPVTVHIHSIFFPSLLPAACGLQRQAVCASLVLRLCSPLHLSWAVPLLPKCWGW